MTAQEQAIAWIVHTHEHQERTADWYWALGLLALAGMGASIYFANYLFALILAIGAATLGAMVARGPRTHWVRVDSRGISMDGTLYPWSAVQSFWVEDSGEERLMVTLNSYLTPQLVVPTLEPQRSSNLRAYIKKYAHEEEQEPHLGEHVAEMLGL